MPPSETLSASFAEGVRTHPERVFGWFVARDGTSRTLSWGWMGERASRAAAGLRAAGAREGDIVLLVVEPGADLPALFLGASLAGCVPAILSFPTPKIDKAVYWSHLAGLVEHSGAKWIVTYPAFAAVAAEKEIRTSAKILLSDELLLSAPLDPANLARPSLDDVALLQHSSGTTGLHKGVALTHRSLFAQAARYAEAIRMNETDVIASWLPLYHDMGLIACFVIPLLRRVPVATMSPFDWVANPVLLWRVVAAHRATLAWLPNFSLEVLARFVSPKQTENLDLSSLRLITNCSEICRPATHRAFLKRYGFPPERLGISYAMAENTFAVTQTPLGTAPRVDLLDGREVFTVGPPIGGNAFEIRPSEEGDGEIWVKSDSMLAGYHNRPDLDAECVQGGWFRTGDLGYLVGDELVVTGRKKEVLILAGRNFYAGDIEAIASKVAGVKAGRAVAFGVPSDATGTEDLVVVAERDPGSDRAEAEIVRDLKESVAKDLDCVVNVVRIVDDRWLVKTTSGKISRSENKRKFTAESRPAGA